MDAFNLMMTAASATNWAAQRPKVKPNVVLEERGDLTPYEKMLKAKEESLGKKCTKIYTAVIYRRQLVHLPESEPLHGTSYYGQAVRPFSTFDNDYLKLAKVRWDAEDQLSKREEHDLGLLACLRTHGAVAFEDSVVAGMIGPFHMVQAWANDMEKKMIRENGGVLQTMSKRTKQTLNQLPGGKGDTEFMSQVANRNLKLDIFVKEMNAYVAEERPSILDPSIMEHTSRVPVKYVNPVTGYKLGLNVRDFRIGRLWHGMPQEDEIKAWAESLPRWAWKIDVSTDEEMKVSLSERGKKQFASDEARTAVSERTKKQLANETPEAKAKRIAKQKEKMNTPEARAAASKRAKKRFASEEARAAASERGKKQFESEEARAAQSERAKKQAANETPEAKAARLAKTAATCASKRQEKLSKLSGKALKEAKKKYASQDRNNAKRKADFEAYRNEKNPSATREDFQAARKAANQAKKAKPTQGPLRKRTITTTTVEEFDSPSSDDDDEYDDSFPAVKRARVDSNDDM